MVCDDEHVVAENIYQSAAFNVRKVKPSVQTLQTVFSIKYYVKFELNPKILNERFTALLYIYIYLDITLFLNINK